MPQALNLFAKEMTIQNWFSELSLASWFDSSMLTKADPLGYLNYFNSASFVAKPIKYWNGSAWVAKPLKYWNGSAWVGSFTPLSLFAGGFQGGWYDPSDLSTMFQNGATQVTADGQPVFLILDKSQNLALGSNTATTGYTNSAFDTFSVVGTVLTFAETGSYGAGSTNNVKATINVGDVIKVVINVTSITGSFSVMLGTIGGAASYSNAASISGTGTKTVYLISTLTSSILAVGFTASAAMSADVEVISYEKISGNHLTQATGANRPLYKTTGGLFSTLLDGIDDSVTSVDSGGSTTAFCFMACVKPTQIGVRQTLFSAVGTNTGYKVELNTSNQLVISAGNGTSYTSATTANAFTNGQVVSIEAYDDGTNLGVKLNNGTLVTVARPSVSAGTAGFTLSKDNGAASGYFKGDIYGEIYTKNKANTTTERADSVTYLRAKGGI